MPILIILCESRACICPFDLIYTRRRCTRVDRCDQLASHSPRLLATRSAYREPSIIFHNNLAFQHFPPSARPQPALCPFYSLRRVASSIRSAFWPQSLPSKIPFTHCPILPQQCALFDTSLSFLPYPHCCPWSHTGGRIWPQCVSSEICDSYKCTPCHMLHPQPYRLLRDIN